jgi:two-component system sensor histidine kinase FlrB
MNPQGKSMDNGMARTGIPAAPGMPRGPESARLADAIGMLARAARRSLSKARPYRESDERLDLERLRTAFQSFEGAAARLESSYELLRDRVQELSTQLTQAHGELARQLHEKQALAERQATLLRALPAGVVVVDRDGQVAEANPAAERLLGTPLVGTAWQAASARLAPAAGNIEWLTPGDEPRRIGLEEQSIGADCGRILLLHDVTEAHAARERVQRNQRLASMGEMAARFAHQLRTPLATAMLYADRLERGALNEQDRSHLGQRLLARLRNLERVTREMLRFVSGERAAEKEIAVGALLSEAAEVMEPLMAARGIAFDWADHTGGAILHGDHRGLTAALLSLLENAAQATAQGGKVCIDGMANSSRVRIRVNDNGSGIDSQSLPRLFEPFYSTRADGTGLGLAIVKSVIEAHGGSIEVSSEQGAGTCFTLILPCSRQSPPKAAAREAPDGERAGGGLRSSGAEREAA